MTIRGRDRDSVRSYTPVATSVRFDLPVVNFSGAAGATYTDIARVYDQRGVLMSPQPAGTMGYVSGTGATATVGASTGLITSVAAGSSVITATFTPTGGGGRLVSDTFTDTATTTLASHTGETGATWALHPSYSGAGQISNANRLRASNTTTFAYYASGVPSTADYDVQAVIHAFDNSNPDAVGVLGRVDTAANTFYMARHNQSAHNWELFKFVAGVSTSLGTFGQTLTAGNDYTLKLEMRGTTLNLYVDGVLRVTNTDGAVTLAGRAGLRFAGVATVSDSAGLHLDTFTATDA